MSPRLLFVTTHFAPDYHYGGVVESGVRLFKYLSRISSIRIVTVSRNPEAVMGIIQDRGRCFRSRLFHGLALSPGAVRGLWTEIHNADVVLVNGIFTFPVTLAQLFCVLLRRPYIVATRGGLEPWRLAQKRLKKRIFNSLVTFPLMRRARSIHVTCEEEERSIRRLGFERTTLISNGIDPELFENLPGTCGIPGVRPGMFVFLFLSRMDKEKGLDILIEAYRGLRARHPGGDFLLVLVGPDHHGYLRSMGLDFETEGILYLDGLYGEQKIKALMRADVFLLPSYSENFGNVIAEALASGTPVITTTGTPWRSIAEVDCGRYIEPEAPSLLGVMDEMLAMDPASRKAMGERGRAFVLSQFGWARKAEEMLACLSGLVPPAGRA